MTDATSTEQPTAAPEPTETFAFDQDYKLKSAFIKPEIPKDLPETGEFWCVLENGTKRLFGPYLTENAALSLIQEDGIDGRISRMTLK